MAGIFNRFLDSMRLNDDDEEYEFEPDEELDLDFDKEEQPAKPQKPFTKSSIREPDSALLELDEEPEEEPRRRFSSRKASNVVPMRQGRNVNFEVCMVKPTSMSDAKELCDILIRGRAVVINMEGVNLELAQRVMDFASGACYSMKGNLQNISRNIFIVTPSNIGLTGDFTAAKNKSNPSNVNINM